MSVRVRCEVCNEIATIQDSVVDSSKLKKFYCTCNNPECGLSFVLTVEFSHILSPSALMFPAGVREKIARMNHQQQRELFASLS